MTRSTSSSSRVAVLTWQLGVGPQLWLPPRSRRSSNTSTRRVVATCHGSAPRTAAKAGVSCILRWRAEEQREAAQAAHRTPSLNPTLLGTCLVPPPRLANPCPVIGDTSSKAGAMYTVYMAATCTAAHRSVGPAGQCLYAAGISRRRPLMAGSRDHDGDVTGSRGSKPLPLPFTIVPAPAPAPAAAVDDGHDRDDDDDDDAHAHAQAHADGGLPPALLLIGRDRHGGRKRRRSDQAPGLHDTIAPRHDWGRMARKSIATCARTKQPRRAQLARPPTRLKLVLLLAVICPELLSSARPRHPRHQSKAPGAHSRRDDTPDVGDGHVCESGESLAPCRLGIARAGMVKLQSAEAKVTLSPVTLFPPRPHSLDSGRWAADESAGMHAVPRQGRPGPLSFSSRSPLPEASTRCQMADEWGMPWPDAGTSSTPRDEQ
ncbi:hypothetical protein CDD83_9034 [Cordyceps sp. RAO-2017]|nr:hypothetical protein CDD83_9034 [Cordyceps sp. RAO-2017]